MFWDYLDWQLFNKCSFDFQQFDFSMDKSVIQMRTTENESVTKCSRYKREINYFQVCRESSMDAWNLLEQSSSIKEYKFWSYIQWNWNHPLSECIICGKKVRNKCVILKLSIVNLHCLQRFTQDIIAELIFNISNFLTIPMQNIFTHHYLKYLWKHSIYAVIHHWSFPLEKEKQLAEPQSE